MRRICVERSQPYIPRPLKDSAGKREMTSRLIFRLSRTPSMIDAKRTVYINTTPTIAAAGWGTSATIKTMPMIGKKYSPIDRRESTHGAELGTETPRTGGRRQGFADGDRPQPAGGARSIACCLGDRAFHHSRRYPPRYRCWMFPWSNFSKQPDPLGNRMSLTGCSGTEHF